ncbi:hypothetical protein M3Y95_00331400 [Aphelenchoides besseyi]|nr:hypothetical protein M3Y95_00331400 [Aphelenchoides besseyi]
MKPLESSIPHDGDCCFLDNSPSPTTVDQRKVDKTLSDAYTAEGMRQRGWCNNDGTPWAEIYPCDEAALLKKGVVSRDCKRASYSASGNCKAKERAIDESAGKFRANLIDKTGHPTNKVLEMRRVTETKKVVEGPIKKKELATRGFIDSFGKIHYGNELEVSLDDYFLNLETKKQEESATEITFKSTSQPLVVAKPSISDNQLKTAKSTSGVSLASKKKIITPPRGNSGSLQMEVGIAQDRGILSYSVTGDGRTYELQSAKQNVVLEFAKKHSCLVFHST